MTTAIQKLVEALRKAKAPPEMIGRAAEGYYDDFQSSLALPITHLVEDALLYGLPDIAERAQAGEFDGIADIA